MISRFIGTSLPRSLTRMTCLTPMSYHPNQPLFSLNNEEFKIAMDESEGLPIQHYFSVKDAAKLPKKMLLTSKTWKTPVKRFFWIPLLALVPKGFATMCVLGGGFFGLSMIPNPQVQEYVKMVKKFIPRYASAITLEDPTVKGDEKTFNAEFFCGCKMLKFSKEDIQKVEIVEKRTLLGNSFKVLKVSIKMRRKKESDLDVLDISVSGSNDFEVELIAKMFEE